jgi:hypothetical protein
MFRGLWLGALVVVVGCTDAPASTQARQPSGGPAARMLSAARTHTKVPKKRKKASGRARPRRRVAGPRSHLPPGWTWPPSETMQDEGKTCLQDLDQLGVHWLSAAPEQAINTPIAVADMDFGGLIVKRTRSKGSLVMDCELARALARNAAPVLLSLGIHELHVGQISADRDLDRKPGERSRHSLGLAVDVYGFVTADGQEHLVEASYLAGDRVLHLAELLLGRTGAFRTVMTPGNDPGPHYNHFHIDACAFGDKVVTRLTLGATSDWCTVVSVLMSSSTTSGSTGPWWLTGLCPRTPTAAGG